MKRHTGMGIKRILSVVIIGMFLMGLPPVGHRRVEATAAAQAEVTFEPLGRLFLGPAHAVAVENDRAYLMTNNGLLIVDVSHPMAPRRLGEWYLPLGPGRTTVDVAVAEGRVYVPARANGFQVYILDARDPTAPVVLGVVPTRDFGPEGVEARDHRLYVTTLAGYLQVFDVSDPAHPREVGFTRTPGDALGLAVVDTIAYIADGAAGVQVYDVSGPGQPRWIGGVKTADSARRIAVSGELAYVADDFGGLRTINISDPTHPQEMGSFFGRWQARWDITVSGRYVYVTSEPGGVRIIDVSDPRQPEEVRTMGNLTRGVVVIDEVAYLADDGVGLQILDVSDPGPPRLLAVVEVVSRTYDVVVVDELAYVATGTAGFRVVDVSQPHQPRVVGQADTHSARAVAISGTLAYVADAEAGLRVIDVSAPDRPQVVGQLDTPGSAIAVAVSSDLVCIADFDGGLRVIDVSNPRRPREVGRVEAPMVWAVAISEHLAYIAESDPTTSPRRGRLRVVDLSNPHLPQPIGVFTTPRTLWDVTVVESVAYVADFDEGLRIINVSDPTRPEELAVVHITPIGTNVAAFGVEVTDETTYVATNPMLAIDVSDPKYPREIGSVSTPLTTRQLSVVGDHIYAAAFFAGLLVYRVHRE